MKTLLNKIDNLIETLEMGLLTESQANIEIRTLHSDILDKYEEGSDNYIICSIELVEAHNLNQDINNL